ncbi:MAG TPA: hypothetical protein VH934_01290, partial [Xanthobacteraceae bacterium]
WRDRRVIMANWRDYTGSPGFDRWLNANAILGSLLAIAFLAMAVAGLYVGPREQAATDFSSVNVLSK